MLEGDQDMDFQMQDSTQSETSQWMTSYADTVTLLLCFFVLFFAADKFDSKSIAILDSIADSLGNSAPAASQSMSKSPGQVSDPSTIDQDLKKALSIVENIDVASNDQILEVDFSNGNLFDAGSYKLNKFGHESLTRFFNVIQPYASQINLEIQGHTDPVPVRPNAGRIFSTNMELSMLRGMTIFRLFVSKGFPEEHLAVAGYGSHKANDMGGAVSNQRDRRISFRITPR